MSDDTPALPLPDIVARLLAPYVVPHVIEGAQPADERHAAWRLAAQLQAFEIAYRDTKNPLWVWRAVLACSGGATLPAWTMAYLVRVAERFWDLSTRRPPKGLDRAIAEALDMKTGARSVFRRIDKGRGLVLATRMAWHIGGGQTETDAKYLVAREEKVSEPTALRAWKKHRALFSKSPTS